MLKNALLATALTMVSGVALAHGDRGHHRGHHHYQPHVRYYPVAPRVVYRPVPAYPVVAPVIVRPAPVYVRPAPVIVPAPAIVFRLHFPL